MSTAMLDREEHELHGRRKGRNRAVGALLGLFVALLFAVTLVKIGPNVAQQMAEGNENPRIPAVPLGSNE
ncbi:MAG: hypothetical protein ACPGGK_11655 [Pikeienuella sp.]